ncbi:MAG: heme-binding domain-containing protein [Anaerolineae bacterium]|nr:heme-binding domain-containing protein [Anaerolineae bacterium]MBT7070785.1 heme-binding domain-containing protein [Anaerolineae bacterium]MBT7325029.1 heme-binding domain-containing protein [Anaerolineae bacterium]
MKKNLVKIIVTLIVLAVAIQLVPYGKDHNNPAVVAEPNWDSPETKALYDTACADCHSNDTIWPWYSNIAPVSWLVQHDVEEGREHLNTSLWGQQEIETDKISEVILEGEMPMRVYLITHPEAKLTQVEKDALAQGLLATFSR